MNPRESTAEKNGGPVLSGAERRKQKEGESKGRARLIENKNLALRKKKQGSGAS